MSNSSLTPVPSSAPNASGGDAGSHTETIDVTRVAVDLQNRALIVSHGIWSVFGKVANLLAVFLNTVLVARLLTRDDFVDLNAIRTLMMLLAVALAAGLAQLALRRLGNLTPVERHSTLLNQLIRKSIVQYLCAAAIMTAVSFVILQLTGAMVIRSELTVSQLVIVVAGILLIGASELISELHRGLGNPGKANLLGGIKGTPFATLLFLLLLGVAAIAGNASFAVANTLYVVATACSVAFGWRSLSRHLHASAGSTTRFVIEEPLGPIDGSPIDVTPSSSSPNSVDHNTRTRDTDRPWRTAIMISASTVISFAMLHGDFLLVSGVTTPEDAAAYVGARRCIQLISMPLIVVNTMAAGVITPLLASGRKTLLEQTLRGFCGAASILAVLMSIPLVVFPELSLRIILGDGYSAGTTALMILVPGQLIFVFTGSCGLLLSLKGCQRTVLTISLVSLILLAVLAPLAGARFGSAGLATVLTTIIAGNNLATWLAARRLTGINTWCSLSWLLKLRRLMAAGKSSWQFRVRPGAADVR